MKITLNSMSIRLFFFLLSQTSSVEMKKTMERNFSPALD